MQELYKDGEWAILDNIAWQMIYAFNTNHQGLNFRKCILIVIVNESSVPVQLHSVDVENSRDIHIVPSPAYNEDSRVLKPKGSLIIFSWTKKLGPFGGRAAGPAAVLSATAFTARLPMGRPPALKAQMGFKVACLEATVDEQEWNKLVFVVKNARS